MINFAKRLAKPQFFAAGARAGRLAAGFNTNIDNLAKAREDQYFAKKNSKLKNDKFLLIDWIEQRLKDLLHKIQEEVDNDVSVDTIIEDRDLLIVRIAREIR